MKLLAKAAAVGLLALGSISTGLAAEEEHAFARDLKILTKWFEGSFDNEEQVWFHYRSGAEDEKPERLHAIHLRLDLPQFGEHVFYVEEYKDNDPTQLVRQRFVTFEADPEANAIRMQQGFFRKGDKYLGKYDDPDAFSKVKPKDIFFMKDIAADNQCDVFWRRVADHYEGKMIEKGCRLGTTGEGPPRYSVHDMTLSANKYWRVDASLLTEDNSWHRGNKLDQPTQMRRADIFVCEGSLNMPGARSSDGSGFDAGQQIEPFKLHNQGGSATFTREADGESFEVLLRKKEYPFYETRPDFMYFSLRKAGERRSIVYTVNDIDSRRLGVSHAGINVHCHREGYDFRQTLEELN